MSLQLILELESTPNSSIELHHQLPGDGKGAPIGRKRMVGNGVVKEMVNFGRGHIAGRLVVIGVALYYHNTLSLWRWPRTKQNSVAKIGVAVGVDSGIVFAETYQVRVRRHLIRNSAGHH
jgi:hypothetical protein